MDKGFLETCLAQEMSLEEIGELAGRHPSTVSHWLKKHDLSASHADRFAPKGRLKKRDLEELVAGGLTLREIAEQVERSPTTVRYWLGKYGLKAKRREARAPGELRRDVFVCRRHGETTFVLEGRGYYRCVACRAERVAERRRAIKRKLTEEAGSNCAVCGYSRCQRALQFHHLDPTAKQFHLGSAGLTRSLARSRLEASKCVLLCANCHAEVEDGLVVLPSEAALPVNSDA